MRRTASALRRILPSARARRAVSIFKDVEIISASNARHLGAWGRRSRVKRVARGLGKGRLLDRQGQGRVAQISAQERPEGQAFGPGHAKPDVAVSLEAQPVAGCAKGLAHRGDEA